MPTEDAGFAPSARAVEVAGRRWLTAQLLVRGFEVATPEIDRGVDLIVFRELGVEGIRAVPLQLKCALGQSFSLDRKYEGRGIPMAYVWNVLSDQPSVYFLTYEEALGALAHRAESASWKVGGSYAATRVSRGLLASLEPYRNRWAWLADRLT